MKRNPPLTPSRLVDLSQFDGCRVAVSLGRSMPVVCGLSRFQRDDEFGNVLKIALDDEVGRSELVICEANWKGRIIPDLEHACDYLMIPE